MWVISCLYPPSTCPACSQGIHSRSVLEQIQMSEKRRFKNKACESQQILLTNTEASGRLCLLHHQHSTNLFCSIQILFPSTSRGTILKSLPEVTLNISGLQMLKSILKSLLHNPSGAFQPAANITPENPSSNPSINHSLEPPCMARAGLTA